MRTHKIFKRCTPYIIIALITLLIGLVFVSADEGDTVVSFSPSSQSVSAAESFNVSVSCVPGQPVKAFEFRLSFDSSILQANSVTEGNIFDGYNTFFNSGTIDNDTGSIVDIYGLIIGQGNVTDPGSFVTISFTAKQNSGTSSLMLNGVGITDESGYISVGIYDGSVTVLGNGNENPPSGGGGGVYFPPAPDIVDENSIPETPVKPSGPTYLEIGVEYVFESFSVDVDGDRIRFRFDWGDGNLSNWSEFVDSNVSVSMKHSWTYISSFDVKVIAQDESGLNSSWSLPLNVTVSQSVFGGTPPVAEIDVPIDIFANETIVFDASGSFDIDGFIVSYFWDFGDGENGSGVKPSHVYKDPGEYHVTLIVTDNDGNKYSTSLIVNVASDVEDSEEKRGIIPFQLSIVVIGIIIASFLVLTIFFKQNIRVFFFTHKFFQFSFTNNLSGRNKIKKIEAKIKKIKKI